jgi:hypothetical protein
MCYEVVRTFFDSPCDCESKVIKGTGGLKEFEAVTAFVRSGNCAHLERREPRLSPMSFRPKKRTNMAKARSERSGSSKRASRSKRSAARRDLTTSSTTTGTTTTDPSTDGTTTTGTTATGTGTTGAGSTGTGTTSTTPAGTTTTGTTATGTGSTGSSSDGTDDINLIRCNECDKPFPIPQLTRTYRIYIPLIDPSTKNNLRISAPQTQVTTVRLNAQSAALAQRAVDAFGGIPLNALDTASDPEWTQPVLTPITVGDPVRLLQSMSVGRGRDAIALKMAASHVTELLEKGSTLAPRADGGFVRLELDPSATVPSVQHVPDFHSFLQNPAIVMPDGQRRPITFSSSELSKLASGVPVVSKSGSQSAVLIRRDDLTTPSSGTSSGTGSGTATQTTFPFGQRSRVSVQPGAVFPPGLAVLLPIDQTWSLLTYQRGRLSASISLTPQEEMTIEVYSWDRRKTSSEDTTTFDSETSADSQGVDRDTKDVFGEVTKTGTFNWGLNGSFSGYGLTLGGNAGNSAVVANVTRNTQQNFHEQTIKASEKVHTSRQLKITESVETGSENRTTRKLKNANLCHPVTFHYFQLDARYSVTTQLVKSDAVFALLLPNKLARPSWDVDYVRTYETVIRDALLDPAVATGLDAARTLWMLRNAQSVICNDCVCASDCTGTEDAATFQAAVSAASSLGTVVNMLQSNADSFDWPTFFQSMVPLLDSNNNPIIPSAPTPTLAATRRALFVDAMTESAPGVLEALIAMCGMLPSNPSATDLAAFNNQFAAIDLKTIDAALVPDSDVQTRIQGLVNTRIRNTYTGMALRIMQFLSQNNMTGNIFVDAAISFWNSISQTENNSLDAIVNLILGEMGNSPGFGATDGANINTLAMALSSTLAAWVADTTGTATAAADAKAAHISTFAATFPPADLLIAKERFDALVKHLLAYSDYYANVIITDLISRGQFQTPTALYPYLGFISPVPIAVVGGKLAFQIDLSGSTQFGGAITYLQNLLAAMDSTALTDDAVLPTPGFVVEPKLSCCSACEDYVEQSRQIDLELKQAQADQARFEASRRQELLAAGTLDPFDPIEPALKLIVDQTTSTP